MPEISLPNGDTPSVPGATWPGAATTVNPALSTGDLKSTDRVSMVFAMSEGPCAGMADLERSIELDGVPIRAADGTWNYEGITLAVTDGTADQEFIPGFDGIESEQSNGTPEVKLGTPSIFNITSINANSARVKISVPSFQKMDAKTGKGGATSAHLQISVSVNGGAYVIQELVQSGWISGYSSGPYVRGYKIALPDGAVRSIKVERLDAINSDTLVANKTYLQGWTEIADVKLRHPYVSLLALSFDAKLFGSIPVVTADWKGLLLRVPANYTPPIETAPGVWTPAVYATTGTGTTGGIWDGTFKASDQWCASPAWAFWTIATNKRYGCGKYLSDLDVDADALYEISKYCDELVTDGMGGNRPRFALNAYLTNDEESFKVLAHIISTARAQLYYSGGKMRPVQDVETDVVALFSPSNVKEGRFEYTGVAKRARHTMAKVSWWDPSQAFKIVPEPIQHLDGIAKYGVQTLETAAFGSTNMGQTRAWGNWALISEQTETEAISFTSGLEGLAVTIGDIIHVQDPSRDGAGMGGRLLGATTTTLALDRPVTLQAGITYKAWVTLNDGTVADRTVTTAPGDVTSVTVTPALASAPQAENQWQLADSTASPSRWRILSIKRPNAHEFEISALANNPAKYALADAIGSLVPTVTVPVVFSPVSGLTVSSNSTYAQGAAVLTATAKWTQPMKATGALAQAQINGAWEPMAVVGASASIQIPNAGTVPVRVVALYPNGRSSVVSGSVSVTDVYSDGIISRGAEKVRTQADWVTAQADYVTLGDKATALGVSRTTFNAAYTALSGVAIRWTDATVDTVISDISPTLPTRWATWSAQCVAMQTAIITATQAAAATDATTKANSAQSAAIAAAAADATAKRVLAEAYADGIVTDEENARIAAASTASTAANAYADLKKTEAAAYADGIVDAEEARAIADATEKYNAAAQMAADAEDTAQAAQATANNAAALARDNNLVKNGNSEDANPTGMEALDVTVGGYSGNKCRRFIPAVGGTEHIYAQWSNVSVGEQYSASAMSVTGGAAESTITIDWLDYTGAQISNSVGAWANRPGWSQVTVSGAAPAGAVSARIGAWGRGGDGATTAAVFDCLYAERKQQAAIDAQDAANTAAGNAATASASAAYADMLARSSHNLIKNGNSEMANLTGPEADHLAVSSGGAARNGNWLRVIANYSGTDRPSYGEWIQWSSVIPCAPLDQFYYEFWARKLNSSPAATSVINASWRNAVGAEIGNTITYLSLSTTYQKHSASLTAPAGACGVVFAAGDLSTPTGQELWFDDAYACRKISAGMLEADIAIVGVIRDPNFIPGSVGNAPTGFKLSGPAFPSTLKDGSTISTNFEVGRSSNMGGVEVGKTLDRTWLAYNRIANGYFYKSTAGWAASMEWSALSYTTGTGSAAWTVTSNLDLIGGGSVSQSIITPPLQTGQTVNLTLRTGWATTSSTGETGNSVKASIINLATGVTTLLGTWYYTHNGQALAWTLRTVDITSIVSAGGEFGIEIVGSTVGFPQPPGTSRTCSIHIDEVKIIL